MKPFFSPLFLGLFALVFSLSSVTYAGGAKKKPTPSPKFATVIESLSSDSLTVAVGQKKTTYKITQGTRFIFNGQTVTANDLKPGMRVDVIPGGFDDKDAEEISATGPAPAAPAPVIKNKK
jgi:hypothetical protein